MIPTRPIAAFLSTITFVTPSGDANAQTVAIESVGNTSCSVVAIANQAIDMAETIPIEDMLIIPEMSKVEEVINQDWNGPVLNRVNGTVEGPSGKETYYNLNMSRVVSIMKNLGYNTFEYWVREDGVKMFGPYVMCAANLEIRPKGTIVETSLGTAIVCDTGSFAKTNQYQLDIAVNW